MVTFTEEILNGKLHFLCSDCANVTLKFFFNRKNRFRFKDSILKELRSHIVYNFLRSTRSIACYDETECYLNVKSREHLILTALTGEGDNKSKI